MTFAALPAAHAACRASVAVPARNEAAAIEATLACFLAQRDRAGYALPPECFEVLVFANNCTDATAIAAERFARAARPYRVFVVRGTFAPADAHIGNARRAVMDACAARMAACDGAVLTTDADTHVAPTWIAATLAELATADAVAGRILPFPDALRDEPPAVRTLLAAESRYRFAVAELDALADPVAYDPWPRHWQQFGASIAVRARVYMRVGGLPAVPRMEDVALYSALLRADARVRHSLAVRVATSMRTMPRVDGGFGTHLAELRACAARGEPLTVEAPAATYRRITARARARALWHAPDVPGALARAADDYGVGRAALDARRRMSATCGAFLRDLEIDADARDAFRLGAEVPVARALATLRDYCVRARAAAAEPTRASAASGAG